MFDDQRETPGHFCATDETDKRGQQASEDHVELAPIIEEPQPHQVEAQSHQYHVVTPFMFA